MSIMDFHLQQLEQKSIYILRETKARFKNPAILWSMGKDSTCMLYLCKRAFFGKLPFPAIHLDSGHDFPETYQFREKIVKEWGVNLIIGKVKHETDKISGTTEGLNKAEALKKLLEDYKFDALIVSIRRDEHGIRAKERYFSSSIILSMVSASDLMGFGLKKDILVREIKILDGILRNNLQRFSIIFLNLRRLLMLEFTLYYIGLNLMFGCISKREIFLSILYIWLRMERGIVRWVIRK